jgi:uncharacterized protein involved in exopolysaccharide biosynthesis
MFETDLTASGEATSCTRDPWRGMRWVWQAVSRYWRLGLAVLAIAVPIVVVGTWMMPRTYYSEARLFVRFGRENQVDPTAAGGQLVSLYESRESEINSLLEILRSQSILDRVVEALGPQTILGRRTAMLPAFASGKSAAPTASHHPQAQSKSDAPLAADDQRGTSPTRDHQRAVKKLQREVTVAAPRKSHIITVGCRASSPALAQRIVEKLIEVYQEEHVRVHRFPASYEFFQQQANRALVAWQEAAQQLRQLKDQLGIVTLESRQQTLQAELASLDTQRMAVQADLKTAQAKVAALESLLADLPPWLMTQKVDSPSAAFDGMRQTLYQLEAQEQDLAARMQNNHPRLMVVRDQIATLRAILQKQPDERAQTTEAINPAWQSIQTSLLNERALVKSLMAREAALLASERQLRGDLEELNRQAITLQTLQQQAALAESQHREYAQRLEQARINQMLDQERITSLSLVQPASFPAFPSSPRRLMVLSMGLMASVLAAFATMLGAACLWPVVETGQQLATALQLPLAGLIPQPALGIVSPGR